MHGAMAARLALGWLVALAGLVPSAEGLLFGGAAVPIIRRGGVLTRSPSPSPPSRWEERRSLQAFCGTGKQRRRSFLVPPLLSGGAGEEAEDGEGGDLVVEEYELDAEAEASLERSRASRMHLRRQSRFFRSIIWLSWWSQAILSTVSGVILVFSNAITDRSIRGSVLANGTLLAICGVLASSASLFLTWSNYLQVRKWAGRRKIDAREAQVKIKRSLRLGIWLNMIGMLFALLGAEQIVGTLVAKLLYQQGYSPFVSGGVTAASVASQQLSAQNFRALDIFVVQANTNSVLSHFCSLCAGLGLLSKSDSIAPES